jgi:hypothetical protein
MAAKHTRRDFFKGTLAAAAGAGAALSMEERALVAGMQAQADAAGSGARRGPVQPESQGTVPRGKLGKLEISRVFLGGNLIGGWAHARDLLYVSKLLKAYHTDEKVLDTMQLGEEHGFNCINTHPNATPLIKRYRKERKGKMVWLAQGFIDESGDVGGLKQLVDDGADTIYIQGGTGDRLVKADRMDLLAKAVEFIQDQGLPAGIGGHKLDVPMAVETAGIPVDYHVKTIHPHNYWSAMPDGPRRDNTWCEQPDETIKYMAKIEKPWIAFKVMAAGAVHPKKAFRYAFEAGADFVMAGMFDFQIPEDAKVARQALEGLQRKRPWRA